MNDRIIYNGRGKTPYINLFQLSPSHLMQNGEVSTKVIDESFRHGKLPRGGQMDLMKNGVLPISIDLDPAPNPMGTLHAIAALSRPIGRKANDILNRYSELWGKSIGIMDIRVGDFLNSWCPPQSMYADADHAVDTNLPLFYMLGAIAIGGDGTAVGPEDVDWLLQLRHAIHSVQTSRKCTFVRFTHWVEDDGEKVIRDPDNFASYLSQICRPSVTGYVWVDRDDVPEIPSDEYFAIADEALATVAPAPAEA